MQRIIGWFPETMEKQRSMHSSCVLKHWVTHAEAHMKRFASTAENHGTGTGARLAVHESVQLSMTQESHTVFQKCYEYQLWVFVLSHFYL